MSNFQFIGLWRSELVTLQLLNLLFRSVDSNIQATDAERQMLFYRSTLLQEEEQFSSERERCVS